MLFFPSRAVSANFNSSFQIAPPEVFLDEPHLRETDPIKLAALVLENAAKMNCRKFVRPKDIVKGNAKLNLAFVCNLFNTHPCLEPVEDLPEIEETREEKTFRNWMNSLGVKPYVHNLYADIDDGVVLFQLFDMVSVTYININITRKQIYI